MSQRENETIRILDLMESSGVKFGTSGARGLADDMTDYVCYAYSLAFLQYLLESKQIHAGDKVAIAGDFRPSSPRIMAAVGKAVNDAGCEPVNCGFIPTPAVACYAIKRGIASIMVTGSHIPDDRNGIKFYKPAGEILKHDEQAMCSRSVTIENDLFDQAGNALQAPLPAEQREANSEFVQRYLDFFPAACLQGLKVGVYEHSSVARDILGDVIEGLGAEVVHLGRSDQFIPVDTEAIRPEDVVLARGWSQEHQLDCIVSADGDGDRPLVSDEHGQWLRGDVAGILCAHYLGARHVATPVSCNSAVEKCGWFNQVDRTRIGSPFVIAAMDEAIAAGAANVVGYEANGGFLTATNIEIEGRNLSALPTRDAVIVPLAILMLARSFNSSISGLLSQLPQRFTSSDRLKAFPTELSQEKLKPLNSGDEQQNIQAAEAILGHAFGGVANIDNTDGIRITFSNGEVAHLRPSGNAPELRCYNEADSEERAIEMNKTCLGILESWR
ncbi:phosphomannomutase [Mariprofundus micogutta]|uniref:Phosphomannomutase n=1 Tax=Mariprofundus micogutta TaxID=1921010 RepID=A0A1L8CJP7_9PROT|nr:phosphomannomutase [Mariprofundus micogutta]GAV19089.1 phosphomannomutase [Mariprofundus micogutta]